MRKVVILVFVAFFCVSSIMSQEELKVKKSELINAFRMEDNKLIFSIYNSGYSNKSSFELYISKKESFYEIELLRIIEDYGKMMPEQIEIVFLEEELKAKMNKRMPIKVLNKFSLTKW